MRVQVHTPQGLSGRIQRSDGHYVFTFDPAANAESLRAVLSGKPGAYRDVALLNAAAALIVAGKAKDLRDGVAQGQKALDSGGAAEKLKRLIAVSNA